MGRQAGEARLDRYLVWSSGLLTAGWVLVFTAPHGIGVGPDGAYYVSVAQHLLDGQGWTGFDGNPYVHWPPLYPLLLALVGKGGLDVPLAARWLNALLLAATVVLMLVWLRPYIRRRAVYVLLALTLVLSKPLVYMGVRALSEPLFVGMSMLSLWGLDRYLKTGTTRALVLAAAAAALASLTRYLGVVSVVTGLVLILAENTQARARKAAIFAGISALPLGLWALRNRWEYGTLTGERYPAWSGLIDHLENAYKALGMMFFPDEITIAGGALVLAGIGGMCWWYRKGNRTGGAEKRLLKLLGGYGVCYAVILLAVRSWVASDEITMRLLLPVYLPLVGSFFVLMDRVGGPGRTGSRLGRAVVYLAAGWVLYLGVTLVRGGLEATRRGITPYGTVAWSRSPLVAQVRALAPGALVYSNHAGALYWHTRQPVRYSLLLHRGEAARYNARDRRAFLEAVQQAGGPVYLAWFSGQDTGAYAAYFVPPENLGVPLVPEATARDGTLYRLFP